MKVTDIRRGLIAALAAGGMLAPSVLRAADLNTNIAVNGDFEDVDINVIQGIRAVKINGWADGERIGYAYSHDGSLNGLGQVIPDYANGGPLAGGGHFYFTSNATPGDIHVHQHMNQLIDVSDGVSGSLIDSGFISYNLNAFFSSYLNVGDFGRVNIGFLDGSGTQIGGTEIDNDNNTSTWVQKSTTNFVPVGTKTIRLAVYGVRETGGGPDGYIDNVELKLSATLPELAILVDRSTGSITMHNLTGNTENISGYSITSASYGSLKPASWFSITDNYDSGNPGPNQVDAAHAWSELTAASSRIDLSEADLASGLGAGLADDRVVNLGNGWITTPYEDLVFQYVSNGQVVNGIVNYVGNGAQPLPLGDLNADGAVNSMDWGTFRANQHVDMTGLSLAEAYKKGDLNRDLQNDHADFVLFKEVFDVTNGSGSFDRMLAAIPEPSTAIMVLAGGLFVLPVGRRGARRE